MLRDFFLADKVRVGKGREVSVDQVEEFWQCAFAVLTQLGMVLDLAGFGVSDEIPDKAWREAWAVVDLTTLHLSSWTCKSAQSRSRGRLLLGK